MCSNATRLLRDGAWRTGETFIGAAFARLCSRCASFDIHDSVVPRLHGVPYGACCALSWMQNPSVPRTARLKPL